MSVVVLPRTHNPSLIKRETSDNPSGGTVHKTPALLKIVDVIENKKSAGKRKPKRKVGRRGNATKRGTPYQRKETRPSAGGI